MKSPRKTWPLSSGGIEKGSGVAPKADAEKPNEQRRGDKGAGKSEARRQQHRQVGANGVEAAMGEVHDAAEGEDERQAERDEEVVGADEQPVQHLLEEKDELHAVLLPPEESSPRLRERASRRNWREAS